MTDLSPAKSDQRVHTKHEFLERLTTSFSALVHRFFSRRRLVAELNGMDEYKLRDIGLSQADLELLHETPLSCDGLEQLAARLRERHARAIW